MEIIISDKTILKRLKQCDWLVWISFILMLIVKGLTVAIITSLQKITKASIENIATAVEANPLFEMAFSLQQIGFITLALILPASAMAYYFYMKRKVMEGKVDINTVEYFVQFAFFILLINIVNDGASLIGVLMK